MDETRRTILSRYKLHLGQSRVPASRHDEFLQWIASYLDFSTDTPLPPSNSGRVRLFCRHLQEKNEPQDRLQRAAYALSLYFTMAKHDAAATSGSSCQESEPVGGAAAETIRLIQKLLGHASLKTTMIYTHCVPVLTTKEPMSPLDF